VNAHDRLSRLERRRSWTKRGNGAGVTVSEWSGHGDLRMTSNEGFAVGAAGQGPFDAQHYLTRRRLGNGNLTHLHSPGLDKVSATLTRSEQ
jgi:hypothetical protein